MFNLFKKASPQLVEEEKIEKKHYLRLFFKHGGTFTLGPITFNVCEVVLKSFDELDFTKDGFWTPPYFSTSRFPIKDIHYISQVNELDV